MKVKIEGYQLEKTESNCPYLDKRIFRSNNLIIESIDEEGLETLLESGYRHFGEYFFRPECLSCDECQPIRVPVKEFTFSRSEKRVLNKNAHFTVNIIKNPVPDISYFNLYKEHKWRFKESEVDSYENWVSSFFAEFNTNCLLEIKDGDILIAVTHLDVTSKIVSAVYCYWNEVYSSFSPGKFSILKGLQYAMGIGAVYYYLGYYIKENKHMAYKINYKPNQILTDGIWH